MSGITLRRRVTQALSGCMLALLIGNANDMIVSGADGDQSEAAQPGQQKTVDQTYKNIQVLKGLPDDQMNEVMAFMQAAVGARGCESCHVKSAENQWAYEKDDNQHKVTARKMIQMVLDINKANFNGRTEVTCYTCHQGHERPTPTPALPIAQVTRNETPGPRPSGRFPTPEQILQKYVQAVGGTEAAQKFGSEVLKGSYVAPGGQPQPLEIYRKPGKILSVITTEKQGVLSSGFDGTVGWVKSDGGLRDMESDELARAKMMDGLFEVLQLKEPYPRMRLAGREKIGDRDAWVLRVQGPNVSQRYSFDVESGLLLRKVVLKGTMIGPIPEQVDFEDFREVAGVRLAFSVRLSPVDPANGFTARFTDIRQDQSIQDARFSKSADGQK